MFAKFFKNIPYEYRLAGTFFVIGLVWLITTDNLLLIAMDDKQLLVNVLIYKEWFSIIAGTIVIFLLTKYLIKKVQNANTKAEKHELLQTEFIKNISHELRTPMNAIIGFSELTMSLENTNDETKEYLKIIEKSSKELLTVVTDLVDTSLLSSGAMNVNPADFEIQPFIKTVYSYFTPIMGQNVRLELFNNGSQNGVTIFSDEEKLRRIFHNLVNNAIKYTYKGKIVIGYQLKEDQIIFFVEDTGVGIKKELHQNLFKKFKQIEIERLNRSGGSGLGLSICKEMIELLDGKIWLESQSGKGSTFYFSIPKKYIRE
ncbi:sensor histidine kinase [Carboxylicivirga linearis]|uniref:histidine kinase n=1 Tax=Carboxylicivirga linearis TaxID=1628157 RepID=A0ABS5JQM6_9BACT|nr:HAMP domain-containing sensor histidine kinase [Carboxylicivirga linearis]MBS2097062.1 HAMP domain-containing histidine kinase [Carboxylicivirga linearis]